MNSSLRILFYDDAPECGGHELMTLAAVRYIITQPNVEVGFMFYRENVRLAELMADLDVQHANFKPLPQDYASGRRQAFRTLFAWRTIRKLTEFIKAYAPDIIVVAQGGIAVSSAGLMAAKRAGVRTISYIPMTHPESLFTASRLKAALREAISLFYYQQPDEYITISQRMVDYLRKRGLRQQITIVNNGIDIKSYNTFDRLSARMKLKLSDRDCVVAVIGRVEFWQKRFDLAVSALTLARQTNPNLKLLVVGDGPDLDAMRNIVTMEGMDNAVVFAAWSNDMSTIYSAIDVLAIPSHYEGVPLVMLEAMLFRLPIIGSAVDGMADILPQHWLFPRGDAKAMATRILEVSGTHNVDILDANKGLVLRHFSRTSFESAFFSAILTASKRNKSTTITAHSSITD